MVTAPLVRPRDHTKLDFAFDLKALSEEGTFEGYASVFDTEDEMRDIVVPGAFARSLADHRARGRLPALLWQHDRAEPIGAWADMREDATGLSVRGALFTADIPRARQAYALLKGGGLSGLSIGFRTVRAEVDETSGVRRLLEIELFEVSLVTFPALDSARVHDVKSPRTPPSERTAERALRGAGFSRSQARALIARGYKVLGPAAADATGADDELLGVLAARMRDAARAYTGAPRSRTGSD